MWMELSSAAAHQQGLTSAGSVRAALLHTTRKRKLDLIGCDELLNAYFMANACRVWLTPLSWLSLASACAKHVWMPACENTPAVTTGSKASLASLAAAGEGQGSYSQSGYSETGAAQGASSSTVIYATSTGRILGPGSSSMLPSASEPRMRTPFVTQGSKSSSWQIAGYSVDYALDWALVVVLGVVLAASEAGVPREGEQHTTHRTYQQACDKAGSGGPRGGSSATPSLGASYDHAWFACTGSCCSHDA